jgi:HlyD family secretion protein
MNFERSVVNDIAESEASTLAGARKSRRRLILLILVSLLVVAAVLLAGKFMKGSGASPADDAKKTGQEQSVTVMSPGNETVVRSINATGTLAARNEVPVGAVGEGGLVNHVYADAGDWVNKGQVLISIDRSVQSQQAASQAAQIEVAKADLQLAQSELDRASKLIARGFISKADIDRKTAARNSAQARVNVARAQLSETGARTARLDIRSPSSGYILDRNVEVGQTVGSGSPALFIMAQGGEMELLAQLGETDLAAVSVGVPALVTPAGTKDEFSGRIWQISPLVDKTTRQGTARIALAFNKALRPGGFASVKIQAGAMTAPVLPESAILNDKTGSFVYIVSDQKKVERRAITTGDVTEKGIAISSGLSGDEHVVMYAGGFLNPGETVNPVLKSRTN